MSHRQIVLDTETTGMRIEDGNRIIEIGCVELINRKITGQHFHRYINPTRDIEPGAEAVHGLSSNFLCDKPVFDSIVNDFMAFISGAELIIHNAPFDLSFLNYELTLLKQSWKTIKDYCQVIDTLQMARQLHVGQRNSLDALCKRYKIDNSKREWHGALLDANLLAKVYLAMTGGQGSFFDSISTQSETVTNTLKTSQQLNQTYDLAVRLANEEEKKAHREYLEQMRKHGKCLWLDD